jgi:hypothetical protein
MGVDTRLMLASATKDAKTNFFIQCSWEMPKWNSIFKHSLTERSTPLFGAVEYRGDRKTVPRLPVRCWKDYRKPCSP